ncbi:MT-A70-domain-containing protein [Panus rudis PR-1116 ss-1]|nr:MT-A70-domain-containing protein [Panus rudis PR-1116 ss-1]
MSVAISVQDALASANDLLASHHALLSRTRSAQRARMSTYSTLSSQPHPPTSVIELSKVPQIPSRTPSPLPSPPSSPELSLPPKPRVIRPDLPPAKKARAARYANYVPEEETIRNDYSQRYVDGGEWPQDWVLGAEPERRFEEYPKQRKLLTLKKASVNQYALAPHYLPFSSLFELTTPTTHTTTSGGTTHTSTSNAKFDVILIDPPFSSSFTWDDLQNLPVPALAADPSFVFMWVGSGAGEGLERGREVLAKWGFRRCEDIVWVKTNNQSNKGPGTDPPTTSLLTRTKQHCLMGIRGTVRRSTDSWFVHCNVDTDVMIWEGDPNDPTLKPPEMYILIENFCLGLRRLEIFGRARTLRRGWVTLLAEGEEDRVDDYSYPMDVDDEGAQTAGVTQEGEDRRGNMNPVKWERENWEAQLKQLASGNAGMGQGKLVVPTTSDIDALRPKSPMRHNASLPPNPSLPSSATPNLPNLPLPGAPVSVSSGGALSGNVPLGRPPSNHNMGPRGGMMGPPHGGPVGGMGNINTLGLGVGNMGAMGAMGMGNMGQVGGMDPAMMGWPDMAGMGGMAAMGNMGNMGNMGGMGGMPGMGMNAMGAMGGMQGVNGMLPGGMGMMGQQQAFAGGGQGWEVPPGDGGMMGMGGMSAMNMNVGGGMNGMGNMNGMPGPMGNLGGPMAGMNMNMGGSLGSLRLGPRMNMNGMGGRGGQWS